MKALWIIAVATEAVGVFFLSVEAIKVVNLTRFRTRVVGTIIGWLNPPIVFVENSEGIAETFDTSGIKDLLWGLLDVFVCTPLLLILWPIQGALEKIEAKTQEGIIGIIGFGLWLFSFVINKFVI